MRTTHTHHARSLTLLLGAVAALATALWPAGASAAPSGRTQVDLASAGKVVKSLRAQGVRLGALAPAKLSGSRLVLPLARVKAGSPVALAHGGGLRLRRGRRAATLRGFTIRVGRNAAVSTRLGAARRPLLRIAAGTGRPAVDRERGTAVLSGARLLLTRRGARALARALGLERLPAGLLGRASLSARFPGRAGEPDSRPPAEPGPPAQPSPAPDPSPSPAPPQSSPAATGHTEWEASHLQGSNDLKSFINYILGGPPGSGVGASVTPSQGAEAIHPEGDPNRRFDYRLPVVSSSTSAGVTNVTHTGQIRYHKPQHGIDDQIRNLTFELPATGTGRVLADGQSGSWLGPAGPAPMPMAYSRKHVLDLALTGITPTVGNGTLTYEDVPATVAAGSPMEEQLGYEAGRPWGRFTITFPAAGR